MEFTPLNRMYGQGAILRKAAALPSWLPLPFAVQHGWFGGTRLLDTCAELVSGLSNIWAWNDESANAFRRDGRDVFAGGAPFLYAVHQRPPRVQQARCGTLVFAPHGTHDIELEGNNEQYVDALEKLPGELKPLVVCLHPSSVGGALDRLLQIRGLQVTSNGPSDSPQYLFRFVENAVRCRYATTTEPSTAIIYSAYLGLSCFLIGPAFRYLNIASPYLPRGIQPPRSSATLQRLTSELALDKMDPEKQRISAGCELGSMLPREQIRDHVWRGYRRLRPHRIALSTGQRLGGRLKTLRR